MAARGFRLTERDVEILKMVLAYRVVTRFHVARLLFPPGAASRAILRLGLLARHGFLERQEQASKPSEGRAPYLYLMTEKSVRHLAELFDCERSAIPWHPADNHLKQLFLDHQLRIQDARVAIAVSARQHGFALLQWLDEGQLRSAHATDRVAVRGPKGGVQKITVVPDFYVKFRTATHIGNLFGEIDRGTTTADAADFLRRDWEKKIRGYQQFLATGLFQARYAAPSFRVVTITTSETRLRRLQQVTEQASGRSRYWFTTADRIKNPGIDILTSPIWSVASRGDDRCSLVE